MPARAAPTPLHEAWTGRSLTDAEASSSSSLVLYTDTRTSCRPRICDTRNGGNSNRLKRSGGERETRDAHRKCVLRALDATVLIPKGSYRFGQSYQRLVPFGFIARLDRRAVVHAIDHNLGHCCGARAVSRDAFVGKIPHFDTLRKQSNGKRLQPRTPGCCDAKFVQPKRPLHAQSKGH